MLVTTLFAKEIIAIIQSKTKFSSYTPDRFKCNWFERIHNSYEKRITDCHIDTDGYWKSNDMDGHDGKSHGYTHYEKFFWRIEPNYCTAGRPCYDQSRIDQIYKMSETKKVLIGMNKSQVCLEWDGFDSPTETCWGLRMKPVHITIYENGNKIFTGMSIHKTGWKKELTTFIEEYYKYTK